MTYNTTKSPRLVADRISELIARRVIFSFGNASFHTVSSFTITEAGVLSCGDSESEQRVVERLCSEGLLSTDGTAYKKPKKESPPKIMEIDGMSVTVPLDGHYARSIRNLIYLFYSRGEVISKAVGGAFSVDESLVEHLRSYGDKLRSKADILSVLAEYEKERGHSGINGFQIGSSAIVFTGFGPVENEDYQRTYELLMNALCRMAQAQKVVHPEKPDTENERYLMHCLLQRTELRSTDAKEHRLRLLEQLHGQSGIKHLPARSG